MNTDLLSLGKIPISSDQPTGLDVRYDPDFEELQAEIDKLSSPSAAGGMDWNKVTSLSSAILTRKSKDILVASYLAVAQIHTSQMEGMAVGLQIYHDLLATFWEDLYPPKKRMRGRLGAIEWWLEKTETVLKVLKPGPLPPEEIECLKENLRQIDTRLSDYFEDPPSVRAIQRFLETIPSLSEEKHEPEALPHEEERDRDAPARPAFGKGLEKLPSPETEKIASARDAQRVLRFGLQKVREATAYVTDEDPANPQIYRWARMAAWSTVAAIPPATNGQTKIPPPAAQVQTILKDLKEKGDWPALLKSAERRLSQFVFWLDLNRFVAEALASLGDRYQDAQDAVCQETGFLIHRLPGLEEMSFSDGTPFADAETQQWLKSIRLGASGVIAEPIYAAESSATGDGESEMAEAVQKAQTLAKQKKLLEAVESLQQGLLHSISQREKLLWRLALSQILVGSKQPRLALPHLEEVLQAIEMYRLEEWDPGLALRGLKMAWLGFDSHSDQASKGKALDCLNRITKLDPAGALRLAKR